MSDPKGKQPIKDSSGSPKSFKSNLSVSVSLQEQVESLLRDMSTPATHKGEPIRIVDREMFDKLSGQLVSLIESRDKHSITPVELSTLNAELSALRLQMNLFKTEAEKSAFAEKHAKTEADRLRRLISEQATQFKVQIDSLCEQDEKAKERLNSLQMESAALKKQIAKAKTDKEDETLAELQEQKRINSERITELNNLLQEHNKVKSDNRASLQKYQNQLLRLTNEINTLTAQKAAGLDRGSFAEIARSTGTSAVNLYSSITRSLSDRAKAFIKKAVEADPDDVKNQAFWLHAALDTSKSIILKPYKVLFEGVFEDIKILDHKSRKAFSPIITAMLDVLTGKQTSLSSAAIQKLIDDLDTKTMKLQPKFHEYGIYTLFDYIESGKDLTELMQEDFLSTASNADRDEFLTRKPFLKKKIEQSPPPDKGPRPDTGAKHGSFYSWVRSKVVSSLVWLQGKAASDDQPRPSTSIIYWLRRRVGPVLGGVLALPVAFMSFITGSWW